MTSSWLRPLGLAGLGMLVALALLLVGVPGRPADPGLGQGGGADLKMRGVRLAGRGWSLRFDDLAVQRRVVMVFGIAGDYEMVVRRAEARLADRATLTDVVREAGPLLWERAPGFPVRFEGLTLRAGPEAAAWSLAAASAELDRRRTLRLQDVRVREANGREWARPAAAWDLQAGTLDFGP